MTVTNGEWALAIVVVIAATVAAILHSLDPVAYAGILGTAIGYAGKGIIAEKKEEKEE